MSQNDLEPVEVVFPELRYDRVCRTSHSEAYLLSEGDAPFGRVDLHFGSSVVHGVQVDATEGGVAFTQEIGLRV